MRTKGKSITTPAANKVLDDKMEQLFVHVNKTEKHINELKDEVFRLRRMLNRIHERAVDGQSVACNEKDGYFKSIQIEIENWLKPMALINKSENDDYVAYNNRNSDYIVVEE